MNKKEVFLQDIMEEEILFIESLSIKDKYIYCTHGIENALYIINIDTGIIENVIKLKGEVPRSYFGTIICGNEIIIQSGNSNLYAKMNLNTKEVEYYKYINTKENYTEYLANVQFQNKIFNFPYTGQKIEMIDIKDNERTYISLDLSKIERKNYFTKRIVNIGEKVILACSFKAAVFEFDLRTLKSKWINLATKKNKNGFRDILLVNDELFLLTEKNELLKTHINFDNEIYELEKFNDEYEFIVSQKEKIILIPKYENKIAVFDIINSKLEYIQELFFVKTENEEMIKYINYSDVIENEKYIVTISRYEKAIVIFDKENKDNVRYLKLKYSEKEIEKRKQEILNLCKKKPVKEGICSLRDFLKIDETKE